MNKKQLEQYCREHAGEPLSLEAEAVQKSNPGLQREVDELIALKKLIALKRHEQPDPGALARCQAGVQARIAAHRNASLWARLREWFELHEQAPAPAFAAAALLVLMAGSAVFYSVGRTGIQPSVAATPASREILPVAVAESPVTNEAPREMVADIPAQRKPIILLRVDQTGEAPAGGVTFGGEESRPVSYER